MRLSKLMKRFGVMLVIGLIGIALAMPVFADHGFKYGDANIDGKVNVGDAILVLRHIVGLEILEGQAWYAADVNGDGSVNVGDAIAILRWIVGLVDQFPAEAALNEALAAVELAENTQQQGDVDNARALVGALPPIPPRDEFNSRLDAVESSIPVALAVALDEEGDKEVGEEFALLLTIVNKHGEAIPYPQAPGLTVITSNLDGELFSEEIAYDGAEGEATALLSLQTRGLHLITATAAGLNETISVTVPQTFSEYAMTIAGPDELEVGEAGFLNLRVWAEAPFGDSSLTAACEYEVIGGDYLLFEGVGLFGLSSWFELTPDYDETTALRFIPQDAATYEIRATLRAVNDEVLATATCTVKAGVVVSAVAAIDALDVDYGTPLEEVGLPEQVEVTLADSSVHAADLTWDAGTPVYNENEPGTYRFTGVLVLGEGAINPGNLTAVVDVNVSDPVPSTYKFDYDLPTDPIIAGEPVEVPVTTGYDVLGDVGYDRVLIKFAGESSDGAPVTFKITEHGTEREYEFEGSGSWGPSEGWPLPADFSSENTWTLIFPEAGNYTIKFWLEDLDTGTVIVEAEEKVKVEADFEAAAKAAAQAAINPSWSVDKVEVAGDELPGGVTADYKITVKTSYDDLTAAQASGRTVTTYFTIPPGLNVTVYYPDANGEYQSATGGEVIFGMAGHPLSAGNIEADGIVYVALDENIGETTFHFTIKLVDACWEDVEYGRGNLEVKTHFVTFDVDDIERQRVIDGQKAIKPEDPTDHEGERYFNGWYTDLGTWESEYDFDGPVTESISLYAKWVYNKYVFFVLLDASPDGIEIALAEFTGEHQHAPIENVSIEDFKLFKKADGEDSDIAIDNIQLKAGEGNSYTISLLDDSKFEDGLYQLIFEKKYYKTSTPINCDDYFEISAEKSTARAAIKPNWEVKNVEIAGTNLPEGVSNADYKLTIGTKYDNKESAQTSGRTVTTYFMIPDDLDIIVYYPVWKDGELTYTSATGGTVAFGMVGHPLSADNIEDDGVVYVTLGVGVTDKEFAFHIELRDAEWEKETDDWKRVVYGGQRLEVDISSLLP